MKTMSQCLRYSDCFETLDEARAEIERLHQLAFSKRGPAMSDQQGAEAVARTPTKEAMELIHSIRHWSLECMEPSSQAALLIDALCQQVARKAVLAALAGSALPPPPSQQ